MRRMLRMKWQSTFYLSKLRRDSVGAEGLIAWRGPKKTRRGLKV